MQVFRKGTNLRNYCLCICIYLSMYMYRHPTYTHTCTRKDQGFSPQRSKQQLPGSAVLLLLLLLLLPVRQNTVQSYNHGRPLHPSWYLRTTNQTRDTFMSHSRWSDYQNRSYSVHGLPSEGVRHTGIYRAWKDPVQKWQIVKTRRENRRIVVRPRQEQQKPDNGYKNQSIHTIMRINSVMMGWEFPPPPM